MSLCTIILLTPYIPLINIATKFLPVPTNLSEKSGQVRLANRFVGPTQI